VSTALPKKRRRGTTREARAPGHSYRLRLPQPASDPGIWQRSPPQVTFGASRADGGASARPGQTEPGGRTADYGARSWLVPVGIIVIAGVGAGILADELAAGAALAVELALLGLAAACWAVGLSERICDLRVVVPALVGLGLCGAALDWPHSDGAGFVVGFMALTGLALRVPRVTALVAGAPVVAAVAISDSHESANPASAVLAVALGASFLFLTSALAALSRDAQHRAEATLAQEAAIREARDQMAVVAERSRLARELHDVLAHCLSGLSLQLERTRLLATATAADARVIDQIAGAQQLARDGMINARRALQALRGDEIPGLAGLPHLVSETASALRIPITLRIEGAPRPLAPEAGLTAYRAVQEALTNVAKHAGLGARVLVLLTWTPHGLSVSVADSGGDGVGAGLEPGGYGLTSMAERVALHGGQLEAGPSEDGFTVRLNLPLDPHPRTEPQ